MKNEQIQEFFTKVAQDESFKAEILKLNKKMEAKKISEKDGKNFISKVVLPKAKKLGYDFTEVDFVEFSKSQEMANLTELSPEDLENVSGGFGPIAIGLVSALGALLTFVGGLFANRELEPRVNAAVKGAVAQAVETNAVVEPAAVEDEKEAVGAPAAVEEIDSESEEEEDEKKAVVAPAAVEDEKEAVGAIEQKLNEIEQDYNEEIDKLDEQIKENQESAKKNEVDTKDYEGWAKKYEVWAKKYEGYAKDYEGYAKKYEGYAKKFEDLAKELKVRESGRRAREHWQSAQKHWQTAREYWQTARKDWQKIREFWQTAQGYWPMVQEKWSSAVEFTKTQIQNLTEKKKLLEKQQEIVNQALGQLNELAPTNGEFEEVISSRRTEMTNKLKAIDEGMKSVDDQISNAQKELERREEARKSLDKEAIDRISIAIEEFDKINIAKEKLYERNIAKIEKEELPRVEQAIQRVDAELQEQNEDE